MNRIKLAGIFNLIAAGIYLLVAMVVIYIANRIGSLYTEIDSSNKAMWPNIYIMIGVIAVLIVINVFIALKLLGKNTHNHNKYYKFSVILIVISFLGMGSIVGLAVMSVILPIYSLTAQF